MSSVEELVEKYRSREISGVDLAQMVDSNIISKSERRKIVKLASKPPKILSERQKLRQEVKLKKALPKLSNEERRKKFAVDAEAEREKKSSAFTVCLGCRKRGHSLKLCPENKAEVNVCFNCSSSEHCLRNCPEKRDKSGFLPYAKCFICLKLGHLSRDCHENPNGLYPNGGFCHICLQKTHLVKDCPERTEEDKEKMKRMREEEEDNKMGPRIGFKKENNESDDVIPLDAFDLPDLDTDDKADDPDGSKRKVKKKKKREYSK